MTVGDSDTFLQPKQRRGEREKGYASVEKIKGSSGVPPETFTHVSRAK